MYPKVYEAIQKFEKRMKKEMPEVELKMIEPMEGADVTFKAFFPTSSWFKLLDKATDIAIDIEDETGVWLLVIPQSSLKSSRS
jgi:hypothetical protein